MGENGKPLFATLASPLSQAALDAARRLHARVSSHLQGFRDAGLIHSPEDAEKLEGPGAALLATGGTERLLLDAFDTGFKPYLLAAHPGMNSLPALLEARAALTTRGLRPLTVYGGAEAIAERLNPLPAALALRGSRLGFIGEPSPWLVASSLDRRAVAARLGLGFVDVPLEELYSAYGEAGVPRTLLHMLEERCVVERPPGELVKALRVYAALRVLVERYGLDAFTLRCFDLIGRLGTTGCLALSLLNSEGLVAGCEGDGQSMLTMFVARRVAGAAAWMANPARVEGGELVLAHCTAPLAWGGRCRLTTHFESGAGVGVDVAHPGGEVVLARIDGAASRLVLARGIVAGSGMGLPGLCRSQVRVRLPGDPWRLLEELPGNHVVMAPGEAGWGLRVFAAVYGVRVVEPLGRGPHRL